VYLQTATILAQNIIEEDHRSYLQPHKT